jgi:hypothetical protein
MGRHSMGADRLGHSYDRLYWGLILWLARFGLLQVRRRSPARHAVSRTSAVPRPLRSRPPKAVVIPLSTGSQRRPVGLRALRPADVWDVEEGRLGPRGDAS